MAAGERLAWGYPDQGPMTPVIAAAMDAIAPGSITVLRLPSALAAAGTVLLSGLLARELGGGPRSQAIAAACTAVASIVLVTGHLLSTTTFDLLAWAALSWLAVRAVRTEDDRIWPVAGLVLGFALLNKPLIAFLAAALLTGVAISGPRRLLRSPWVWAGAAIALALWSPWLIWQAAHGWPQLEVAAAIASDGSTSSQPRWAFLPFQLLLVSPLLAPVWIAGIVRLFRDPELRPFRFLAWSWVALAATFIATGGKPYYLAGLFPALLAAGAPAAVEWLGRGRRRARTALAVGALAGSAAVSSVIALPLLPTDRLEPVIAANPDVAETVGWPSLAATVSRVQAELRDERDAVVFTRNYGEAGAIDRYGPALGLPDAYSGHNGYWHWGPPPDVPGPVIVVGFVEQATVSASFRDCTIAARIGNEAGLENGESGAPVRACAGTRRPWSELWPTLLRLG